MTVATTNFETVGSKVVSEKLDRRFKYSKFFTIERTHLSIDKLRAEHIRQEQNRLVLRVVSSGSGNIRIDSADLLPFTFWILSKKSGLSR